MATLPPTKYYWRVNGGADDSWTEETSNTFDVAPFNTPLDFVTVKPSPATTKTIAPWLAQGKYESVDPNIWLDFSNNRYAANNLGVALSDLATYTRTGPASYIDVNGLMQTVAPDVMRLNWNPITHECEGFYREESRTNLFLNSTAGATQGITVTAQAYTVSFYGSGTITFSGAYTGTLVGAGAYPNRSSITFTPSAGTVTCTVTGTVQYVNFEAGSSPTSWIPTTGSTAVRGVDILKFTNSNVIKFSDWWPASNATIRAKYVPKTLVNNKNILSVSDGGNTNRLLLRPGITGTSGGTAFSNSANVTQFNEVGVGLETLNTFNAQAFAYKANDCRFCCNGILGVADTSVALMVSPNQMNVGGGPTDNENFNGCISEIRIYNARLSDVNLLRLGSLTERAAHFVGDSLTAGLNASSPLTKFRWSSLVANINGIGEVNGGISGTVLQNTPLNSTGLPKPNNARDRYTAEFTGANLLDEVYILYGINDIRNSLTETNLTAALFENDLREIVAGLISAGYAPSRITLGTVPYFMSLDNPTMHSEMNTAIYNCARDYGTKYADVYTAMVNAGGAALIDTDSIHPVDAGHIVIATAMANATLVN